MLGSHDAPNVGDRAPDFTLADQHGNPVHLADLLPRGPVVLFFYPKDQTAGCTAQVCEFRDRYEAFAAHKATVLGISGDDQASHAQFSQKHTLPFTLLSDPGSKVRKLYRVPRTLGILPGRVTYVIDALGVIRHIFNAQLTPRAHVPEALSALKALASA